jgi:hypothetical protein
MSTKPTPKPVVEMVEGANAVALGPVQVRIPVAVWIENKSPLDAVIKLTAPLSMNKTLPIVPILP